MNRLLLSAIISFAFLISLQAQYEDTLSRELIDEIVIKGSISKNTVERLPEVQGTVIYAGKKNEVIRVASLDADLSINNSRQIFAKVPGISIWENDGSGIQMGVATRGLSPNRSWEFNTRQNGVDISSEMFGYPEAYFTPPTEALRTIEVVRGAASLQYGPQFGGLLNFVVKKGESSKPITFETQQTLGSYGLFNSYNAVGGTVNKVSYYAYYHHRQADGWRDNSEYNINTAYASVNYAASEKLSFGLEYTHMQYVSQQAGGLTDDLLDNNARQSLRSRNWFNAPWNIISLTSDVKFDEDTQLNVKLFGTIADRNSVGFNRSINVADTLNLSTGSFNPRQLDRDSYFNLGGELRFLKSYNLWNQKSSLAAGMRVYRGSTDRRQLGVGTRGSDFDLTIEELTNGNEFGRDLAFITQNYAFFAENTFKINSRLTITPGFRYELIRSTSEGYIPSGNLQDNEIKRNVFLFGVGAGYKATAETNVYANFSQSFRPVTFSEFTPSATTDVIDPELKDASGYNIDYGYRGRIKDFLTFDIGGFHLRYNNRIGTILQDNVPFRTNIGTSMSEGLESFIEIDPIRMMTGRSKVGYIKLFSSFAYVNARYTRWDNPATVNNPETSIVNKRVENAPRTIGRYGLNYNLKKFSATFQLSHVGEVYTDAANTEIANAAATVGLIPSYTVMDASFTLLVNGNYNVKGGVNNLSDARYATRRAGGYPGPGLMPGNGRTFFVSVGAKF